jgi:2-phosphosulfolactate phosphatase
VYSQHPYRCRLDWGRHGTLQAAERGDILVIVDTLSFSTAVATAVHYGGSIYPCSMQEQPAAIAQRIGGEVAVSRFEVPVRGRFSLSPATLQQITPGTRVVLASPNGATCSRYARLIPYLLVGTLINAQAVARAVTTLLEQHDLCVTVIACGERWETPSEDGELRIAIEDYLGAGAILSYLSYEQSPEARVCAGAFVQAPEQLKALLWECGSGRELRAKGFGHDVEHAAQLNLYEEVPLMQEDRLAAWNR